MQNNKEVIFHSLFISIFLITKIISFFDFATSYFLVKLLCLIYLLCIIVKSWAKSGIFSIYSLFVDFTFFFIYSRLFFDLIGYIPINEFYFFGKKVFSEEICAVILEKSIVFFACIDLGYYFRQTKSIPVVAKLENPNVLKLSIVLFILCSIWFGYKAVLDFKYVIMNGYTALLTDIHASYPFWIKGAGTFFVSAFYLLLIQKTNKKTSLFVFFIYCLVMFMSGLRGSRATILCPLIFTLYMLNKDGVIIINIKKLLLIVATMIFLIFIVTFYRGEDLSYVSSIKDIFYYIFYNQGNTFGTLLYYQDNISDILSNENFPIIIEDLRKYYVGDVARNGTKIINYYANINNIEGIGLGESFYLELINLPLVISIFVCFFVGWAMRFVERNILRNRYLLVFFCICVGTFFYMPRDTLLGCFAPLNFVYCIMSYLFLLFNILICKYAFKESNL